MSGELPETALFTVGGAEYAFGLEWVTASHNTSTSAHVRRQAMRLNASHLAWRPKMHQVGIARINRPRTRLHWSSWRAAAAAFADLPQPAAEPHTMIGAFAFLSGEIWVVAASQGRLFSDGDRFFTDQAAAREHFRRLYDRVARWGAIFAPAEWAVPRANSDGPLTFLAIGQPGGGASKPIHRILNAIGVTRRPGVSLSRLRNGTWADLPASAKTAICLMAVGALLGGQHLLARPHKPPAAPLPQQVIVPWYPAIEDTVARIDLCVNAILQTLERGGAPGWEVGELSCDNNSVSLTLAARRFAPLSTLADFQPDASVQGTTRTASLSRPLGATLTKAPIAPPLPAPDEILAKFGHLDETLRGINLFTNAGAPTGTPPVEMGVPRPRPYRVMSWSLQTGAPPQLWRRELSSIRDVEITTIAMKRTDGPFIWIIKGVAYVAQ
jgi:hypothetical protein